MVLAVVAAAGLLRAHDGAPGTRHWVAGSSPDRRLDLTAVAGPVEPLHARHVDLMSLQVAQQPEELRRYGVVTCLLHHDPLDKGVKPTPANVRTVACQRRLPSLTVQATGMSPALEHDPALVARLVLQASEALGGSNG